MRHAFYSVDSLTWISAASHKEVIIKAGYQLKRMSKSKRKAFRKYGHKYGYLLADGARDELIKHNATTMLSLVSDITKRNERKPHA